MRCGLVVLAGNELVLSMGVSPIRYWLYIASVFAVLAAAGCQFSANLEGGPYWPCPENGECRAGCSCLDGQVCVPVDPDRPAAVCAWCASGTLDCDGDPENGCEVRPKEDPEHCGGCGISCGQNAVCQGGDCKCLADWGDCFNGLDDGCETRLVDNDDHCGGCSQPCDQPPVPFCEGQTLVEHAAPGECAGTDCSYPQDATFCPNGCEDGRCLDDACGDVYCRDDEECIEGACVCVADDGDRVPCDDGQRCCDGQCVLRFDNDDHCGACRSPCPAHMYCEEEICVCDTFWGDCDPDIPGCETLVKSSDDHCGACDNPCGPNQHCAELECTCDPGWGDCDTSVDNGCETDTASNQDHCGGCSQPCPGEHVCCDGECIDTSSDPEHCGDCGIACTADEDLCCDGSCADSMSSLDHCGACNDPCPDGYDLCCGGTCANSLTSPDHCGACFNDCVGDKPCQEGRCGIAGQVDCGSGTCPDDSMQCCWDGSSLGCHPTTDCSVQIMHCDGPEDCLAGEVCCRPSTGDNLTRCSSSNDCSSLVLCSSDQDCAQSAAGNHCCPEDFEGLLIYACVPEDC